MRFQKLLYHIYVTSPDDIDHRIRLLLEKLFRFSSIDVVSSVGCLSSLMLEC